jgi:hypothetical protein
MVCEKGVKFDDIGVVEKRLDFDLSTELKD